MKKMNQMLNIVIGSLVGAFLGKWLYLFWDLKNHPEIYAVQSAPWYTGLILYGIVTMIVVLVLVVIKIFISRN